MKTKNVAKRLGIASLCLATAISAFSGIASFETSNAVAEEATTVALSDFITVSDGATVAKESRTVYIKKNDSQGSKSCLRVSSEVAYEATFNQVFQGNTELRFAFPDDRPEGVTAVYGNFKFRITDVTDATNFFDIVYKKTSKGTTLYVEWNGHTIQTNGGNGAATYNYVNGTYYYDDLQTGVSFNYAPAFMQTDSGNYGKREARLQLKWTSAGQLWVVSNSTIKQDADDYYSSVIAKFDGTYNETKSKNGFNSANKTFGLPMMSFPNGYKISFSSSYNNANTTDHATDVSFWQIRNDGTTASNGLQEGGAYYTFGGETVTKTNYMKAYDELTAEENAGKTLLGWEIEETVTNDAGEEEMVKSLYSTKTALKSADISAYKPVFLGFDTINGASVRIDLTGGQSGIRFMTLLNKTDYAAAEAYIQSKGTLMAYTNQLTKGRFDATNYATEIAEESTSIRKVENTKNTFNFDTTTGLIGASGQPAYSFAVVDIEDYTKKYSARGYIEVKYADETTQIFYTDYNAADNSRSVAEVAYKIKTNAAAEYENYEQAYKDVIDSFAAAYVAS